MRASDWVRSNFVAGSTLTDEEWQELVDNRQPTEPLCDMTVAEAKKLLASGKHFGYMYQYQGKRVLVSFLDKSATDMRMWRLAFFSFDPGVVDTNTIVELILRAIKEIMVEQYFGRVNPKAGTVRGIYYYADINRIGQSYLFDEVLKRLTETLTNTNFSLFTDFSSEIQGGRVVFYLTYKGA